MLKRIIIIINFVIFLFFKVSFAQIKIIHTVIPEIYVGYMFKAGLTIGAGINYQPINYTIARQNNSNGINLSATFFRSTSGIEQKHSLYKAFSANLTNYYANISFLKLGYTKHYTRWGRESINLSKSGGLNFELGLSPLQNDFYVSYRRFGLNNVCTGSPLKKANVLLISYLYPFITNIN